MQIVLNALSSGSIYLLIAISFSLIYYTVKFLHIAHAINITLGAYLVFLLLTQYKSTILFSILFSVIIIIVLAFVLKYYILYKLRQKTSNPLILLLASFGLYIVLQNLISLIWGDETKSFRQGQIETGNEIFGAYITDIQLITIAVSVSLFILTLIFLKYTRIGLRIRAISSNETLSNIFGINSDKVILWSFGIGSALAAVAGILVAFDTDMTPTMGFNLLIYGVVTMIIGGIGSTWGLVGGAFLLATAQHLGAYYIGSQWMEAIAYIILILFLIWKPLGFSGKRLKKVEI